MFNVRSLPLLLLCTCLFAFQPPDINNTKKKRELSNRKDLPQNTEKIAPNINYTNSSNNDRDTKKATGTLKRRKRFAHLTRLHRIHKLEDDDFEDEDDEEENLVEEPYLQCKENKCKNGGSCFQRGKEFWCVCGTKFAGKWCEIKRELSIEGVGCDKSTQYRLTIALGVVILIFLLFLIILMYWCRRRVPRWKNEKEEWDQLLKDRLDDEYRKKMRAPPLPPRRTNYSPKQPKPTGSSDSSPKYISLTDIRKYLETTDVKEIKKSAKDISSTPSNQKMKVKPKAVTDDNSLHRPEKSKKESRSKLNVDHNTSAATVSGGYHPRSSHMQTELKLKTFEILSCDTNSENIPVNSKKSLNAFQEQHTPRSRRLSVDSRSSNGKPRFENFPPFSESSDDHKERLLDEGRSS